MRKAFTLIELLVVIAIIAILAAILFPVFAQAKLAAKKISDLSNAKELGTSTMLYMNDADDLFYPHRTNCNVPTWHICPQYDDGTGHPLPQFKNLGPDDGGSQNSALSRFFWIFMLQPYSKNQNIFMNPAGSNKFTGDIGQTMPCLAAGCTGIDYGGQNSYGHNDAYLSPASPFAGGPTTLTPVSSTSVPRIASTIMLVDSTYYGAAPDVLNNSGFTQVGKLNGNEQNWISQAGKSSFYLNYWMNIGNSTWSYNANWASPNYANAVTQGQALFNGVINCQFADGHAKALQYSEVVGDICLWTTDSDGAHPACN